MKQQPNMQTPPCAPVVLPNMPAQDPNRFKLAKQFSLHRSPDSDEPDYLQVDSYLDAKDTVNKWCVAVVKNINYEEKAILVSFDGWSAKFDLLVKRTSSKIAPFRTHTVGYTGQVKQAYRDFLITPTYMAILEKRIREIISSNFLCFQSGYECTQFLRGELFQYVDSLLTLYDKTTVEDLPAVFNFIELMFELILKWYEVMPAFVGAWKENHTQPGLINVDLQAAISMCGYEISQLIGKMLGVCKRAKGFWQKFKTEYVFKGNYCKEDRAQSDGFLSSAINKFGAMGGFDKIAAFVQRPDIPLPLIVQLLSQMRYMHFFVSSQYYKEFGQRIAQSLEARLNNMTPQELKETEKEVMRTTTTHIELFTRMYQSQILPGEISETLELKNAFQFLKSPYFELKIRGMNDFKNIFQKVNNRNSHTDEQLSQKDLPYCQYLTFEKYKEFLIENRVLELIFTETPHPELIKRSLQVLYLRCTDTQNPIDEEIVDQIWKCCTEKHEAVVKASFSVIQDLIQYITTPVLELFWSRVKRLEALEFDETRVQFLKQYTINALSTLKRSYDQKIADQKSTSSKRQQSANPKIKPPTIDCARYLNLSIFWQIAQEENSLANQKTKDYAIQALIEITSGVTQYSFVNFQTRIDFLKLALDNLKQGTSVNTSIQFIRSILKTFPLDSASSLKYTTVSAGLSEQSTRERVISFLLENKLYDLILMNLQQYMSKVQNAPNWTTESRLSSKFTHKETIDVFMSLIEYVIVNSKSSNLDFTQLQTLYETIVKCAVTEYESEVFFKFLTKENENGQTRERKYLLDEKRATQVFQEIFCNPEMLDCSKLCQTGFNCFKLLFLNVNSQLRNLDIVQKTDSFNVLKLGSLQGFQTLWQIPIFSQVQTVKDQAMNFLVDMYLNAKPTDKSQKVDVIECFLAQVDAMLGQLPQGQWSIYRNWLNTISTFIKRFDFEHVPEQPVSQDPKQNLEVGVTLQPQGIKHTITVNANMQLWQIIIQIGKAFKMKCSEFRISTSSGLLDTSIYNDLISAYRIDSIMIKRFDEKILDKELPRRSIAQNSQVIKKILDLITHKPGQEINQKTIEDTFDLIESLPVNLEYKAALEQEILKIGTKDNATMMASWCHLFHLNVGSLKNANSLETISPQACYNLLLLSDLVQPKVLPAYLLSKDSTEAAKRQQKFCQQFVYQGGFSFLIEFFNFINKKNAQTNVLRCCALESLQELLRFLLNQKYDQVSVKTLFDQNLTLLQSLTQDMVENGVKGKRDAQLMEQTLVQIKQLIDLDPLLTGQLYSFPDLDRTLLQIYTQLQDGTIQAKVSQTFFQICKDIDIGTLERAGLKLDSFKDQALALPTHFFMKLFIKQMIPASLENKQNTQVMRELFSFVDNLLTKTEVYKLLHVVEPLQTLVTDLTAMIKSRPILETSGKPQDEDVVLSGILSTFTNILAVKPQIKDQMTGKNELIMYLLHDCLFLKENKRQQSKGTLKPPKCKSANSRQRCLSLIRELCVNNETGNQMFIEYLRDDVFGNNVSWFWRTPRKSDWQITAENKFEKSSTGYVGLKNIGCICYMNSIVQNLFMIPAFRKAMLEVYDRNMGSEPKTENCLYQLKRMFTGLQNLGKQYYNPKKFCSAFKDIEGNPIDPRIQKDGDEFLIMLIDQIENLIKGTKEEAAMKNLLYGAFVNEMICKGCPHVSEREEPFMAVQLQVKDKHSIQESLDTFVQGEMLEGDNAYYCEKCDKKRDTLKRQTFKRLPNVLFLNLKRFEFNFDTMSKFKINDFCEFPRVLDMRKYTQEYIKRQDLLKEMDDKNLTFEDLDEEQQAIYNRQQCDEYSQYNLVGVVVHQGTTESGHYYSYIKDREEGSNEWYEFNDKMVTNFNPDDIPEECFGGDDPEFESRLQQYQNDAAMQQILAQQGRAKNRNAYILIYERAHMIDQARFHEFAEDNDLALAKQDDSYMSQSLQAFRQCRLPEIGSIQISPEIFHEIQEKNSRFWLTKHIFNKPFMEQSYEILSLNKLVPTQDYTAFRSTLASQALANPDQSLCIYKFIVTFLLTVAKRSSARVQIPAFVKLVRNALKENVALSIWLCETFSDQALIKEFLIDCVIQDMSRFVTGLLNTAMQTVYKHEKRSIIRYVEELCESENYISSTQGPLIKQQITYQPSKQQRSALQVQQRPVFAAADQVKIYKMTGSTAELPILIVMINSFLHYQSCPVMADNLNLQLSAQFQRVFCCFSELGPEACLYLLNTGAMKRMLKLFLTQKIELDPRMTDIPLFHIESNQSQNFLSRNQSVSLDTKVPLNDRKHSAQSSAPHQLFLIRTISQMMRYCSTTPGQKLNTKIYSLEKSEIELLVHEVNNRNWWNGALLEYPIARDAVSKIWANVCHNDIQQSQVYLKQIFMTIQEGNFQLIKKLERLVLDFVQIPDAYQPDRISRCLNYLYEVLKRNTQYWKQADSLIELVYKLALRCRAFAVELAKNKNLTRMIEQLTKENPSFPLVSTATTRLFKEYTINWQSLPPQHKALITEQRVTAISNYSKNRLSRLNYILQAQLQGNLETPEPDSDDDCYSQDFSEGELVDAKFYKVNCHGWYTAEVIVALDEMVRVKIPQAKSLVAMWIEKETYKMARAGSQTKNEKSQNHVYFNNLMQVCEQVAQSQSVAGAEQK